MSEDRLLMIFVRNMELGKVKTRLAKTLGPQKALDIYRSLLSYTHKVTLHVNAHKGVFYSNVVEKEDIWNTSTYQKFLQDGRSLGERMSNAFRQAFDKGYTKVIIIGSDCPELSFELIENAYQSLEKKDIVIGPAKDGGYYLLGMKKLHVKLFEEKSWSSEHVYSETLQDIEQLGLSYEVLPVLSDIDREEDLNKYPDFINTNLKNDVV